MLMDSKTPTLEEVTIHIKEGELRQNVYGAWACMTLYCDLRSHGRLRSRYARLAGG